MGVRIDFQTSGIVGVTEIFTSALTSANNNMTLATTRTESGVESEAAFAYVFTGREGFTINLPTAASTRQGAIFKFKYLMGQLQNSAGDNLYYPNEMARDTRDQSGLVTTPNNFPAFPVVTIDRNGNPIDGGTENIIINIPNQTFELVYFNTTQGWVVL